MKRISQAAAVVLDAIPSGAGGATTIGPDPLPRRQAQGQGLQLGEDGSVTS